MRSDNQKRFLQRFALVSLFLTFTGSILATGIDDQVPDVRDRVARISVLEGKAQIRRMGVEDWEQAVDNLPVVEGDELVTERGTRLEIQFGSGSHLRLDEFSTLKILALTEDGIAVSLPEGTLSLRLYNFNKDRAYFEIDAPKTTISVQRSGRYRVDAGSSGDPAIFVSAAEDGEARIYSENSGFTLKNGRKATIQIDGPYTGEWEMAAVSEIEDGFGLWVDDRELVIAKLLKDSYYDRYYDRDIYGAEELNDYGDWVHTVKFGYVWRPYARSISSYADWTPYRYGHWRWIPPYGWVWVNDEPWGWATYHHGRWYSDGGHWYWSPYGYYRNGRSWWSPALVSITIWNGNVCWYPLPYYGRYEDFNKRRRDQRPGAGAGPTTSPTSPTVPTPIIEERLPRQMTPPFANVPTTAVISVSADQFGRTRRNGATAPLNVAKTVLNSGGEGIQTPGILPPFDPAASGREIRSDRPKTLISDRRVETGAVVRTRDGAVDGKLRKTVIRGSRSPIVDTESPDETPRRRTGAVGRPQKTTAPIVSPDIRLPIEPRPRPDVREQKSDPPVTTPDIYRKPRYEAPGSEEKRRDPPIREERRTYPPPPKERPKSAEPKEEAPRPEPVKRPGPSERKNKDG
ncbi:MAG: DUF6600 domain-containing protein [Pyrinomonadaceae bacterium]